MGTAAVSSAVERQPRIVKAWQAKLACSAGVLAYYVGGYFTLNRLPFEVYHDVPKIPLLDGLPLIPWTIIIYHSVFLLGALGIWLQPSAEKTHRYLLSVIVAYSINYLIFALYPTSLERPPLPGEESLWSWAIRLTRVADEPHTCFPSLHLTNCALAVFGLWGSPFGRWFALWMLGIAVSTLTSGQHVFLDLPAGAFTGWLGMVSAARLWPLFAPGAKAQWEG